MQKKDADKDKTRKFCDFEENEKDCPDYEKSKYTNLCKWGMYEGTCICYKDNQCTG